MQHRTIEETFRPRPSARWRCMQTGGGRLIVSAEGLRLALPGARRGQYANAQIDDYGRSIARPQGLPRRHFPWRSPLRLTVHARASGPLLGTAGFGFWNNPLTPLADGPPVLPAALWFFHASAPADLPLAMGVPGQGWKAACIDATRPAALAWAPLAPPVLLLNRRPWFYARIWPRVQRALRIAEAPLPTPDTSWRTYTLEWHASYARFAIDGAAVLETERPPGGPLGFVAWVDNQWAVATPRGRFGWGLLDTAAQWLDLGLLRIEAL
jgi:hypothetical protein